MSKDEKRNACRYCGSEVVPGVQKCRHCGEWLRWTWKHGLKTTLEQGGRVVVIVSLVLAVMEMNKSRLLEQINAVNNVQSRYIELDRLLIEKPEYSSLFVPVEDYESTVKLASSREGARRLKEGQFISYAFDIFETEFFLRDTYGLYPKGTEFVFNKFVTNPKVIEWWYKEGLRQWYSEDFRGYVEGKMPKAPAE